MALRIGQAQAASYPAVLDTDEEGLTGAPSVQDAAIEEAVQEPLVDEPMDSSMESGSAVEWLQEAVDLCQQYQCPEDLAYAVEQALIHLIGPSAVGATESPEAPVSEPESAPVVEEEEAE